MQSDFIIDILKFYYNNITPNISLIILFCFSLSVIITFSGKIEKTEKSAFDYIIIFIKRTILPVIIILSITSYLMVYTLAKFTFNESFSEKYLFNLNEKIFNFFNDVYNYVFIIPIVFLPILLGVIFRRFIVPVISSYLRKWRITQSDNSLSDVRTEIDKYKPLQYNPTKYYKEGYFFIGCDENKEPIYLTDEFMKKNHFKILGPSQTGKGVLLALLTDQAIRKDWGVWNIDIKPDNFMYDIIRESCEVAGRNLIVVDLTDKYEGLGYSPFINGSERDRISRITKAMKIQDTGKTADYYLAKNREALLDIFQLWDGHLPSLLNLLSGKDKRLSDEQSIAIRENSGNIRTRLKEWLMYDVVKAKGKQNFNVADALKNGDVVYIRGTMTDQNVLAFNIALIDEMIQNALNKTLNTHHLVILDEARFLITDTLANSLATVLAKGVTMGIAYQAKEDTQNLLDKTLNADSIQNGIETNTQLTFSYRAESPETAKWIAEKSGKVNVTTTKYETVEANDYGGETWTNKRMLGQEQEYLIPENVISNLPPTVGVIMRPMHLAQVYFTCWIPVKKFIGLKEKVKTQNNTSPHDPESDLTKPVRQKGIEISKEDNCKADLLFKQLTSPKPDKETSSKGVRFEDL